MTVGLKARSVFGRKKGRKKNVRVDGEREKELREREENNCRTKLKFTRGSREAGVDSQDKRN